MDAFLARALDVLFTYGLLGIYSVIVSYLYLKEKDKNDQLYEKRIEEAKISGEALSTTTAAMNDVTRAVLTKLTIKGE